MEGNLKMAWQENGVMMDEREKKAWGTSRQILLQHKYYVHC